MQAGDKLLVGLGDGDELDEWAEADSSSVFPGDYRQRVEVLLDRAGWTGDRRRELEPRRRVVADAASRPRLERALSSAPLGTVDYVEFDEPRLSLPTRSDDWKDEPYGSRQKYLHKPPVRASRFWDYATGAGVALVDIELGWCPGHSDFAGLAIRQLVDYSTANPQWRAHGTSALGVIAGRSDKSHCIGIAHGIEHVAVASAVRAAGEPGRLALAMVDAIEYLLLRADDSGDAGVILLELQVDRLPRLARFATRSFEEIKRSEGLPVEVFDLYFWLIRLATDLGICVVECAGNSIAFPDQGPGLRNLDLLTVARDGRESSPFERRGEDSGAIMVGGTRIANLATASGSNVGKRIDVFARSSGITAPHWYDEMTGISTTRHGFSGTSAAGSVIAGLVVLIQSVRKGAGLTPFAPEEIRSLISNAEFAGAHVMNRGEFVGMVPCAEKLCRYLTEVSA